MIVFVSGCCGYIGSVLVEVLLNKGHKVIGYDNLLYRQHSLVQFCHNDKFDFVYGDVRDKDKLIAHSSKADVIIPLAAIVGAAACDKDPQLARKVNYDHVENIAKIGKMVILPQTNSGYGVGQGDKYCTENTPMRPITVYGKTKCEAEKVVLDVGGVSLRLATVFGLSPRMRLDLLVNDFTYKAMSDGYIVLFEKDFKRNYIHVRDVVSAFCFMIDNYEKCKGHAYNVGLSTANLSKYELALKIKEHIPGFSIQVDEIKKDPDKRNYIVSNGKIESQGWRPRYSLDDGIKELKKGYSMLFESQQVFTNL